MNKYIILFVTICMAIMFYILNQRIDQLEQHRLSIVRALHHAIWASERNNHRLDRNLNRIDNNFEIMRNNDLYINDKINKLFDKQYNIYSCISNGTQTISRN